MSIVVSHFMEGTKALSVRGVKSAHPQLGPPAVQQWVGLGKVSWGVFVEQQCSPALPAGCSLELSPKRKCPRGQNCWAPPLGLWYQLAP